MDLGTLTIDWALGDHTLTSVTGYAQYDYQDICDCDFAAIPLIQVDATEDYDQFSQEIRLTSPGGERFDYIVGMYYQESELNYRSIEGFGASLAAPLLGAPAALTPNLTRDYTMDQDQDMWAVFASGTYSFTDSTRLMAGIRYFDESKTASHVLDKSFHRRLGLQSCSGLTRRHTDLRKYSSRIRSLPRRLCGHRARCHLRRHLCRLTRYL